jgi:hypothetical protein
MSDELERVVALHEAKRAAPALDWTPVDLEAVLRGEALDPSPCIMQRTDGSALMYAGRVHLLFGEPEAAKGWLALATCVEQIRLGEPVLYVDFEDTASTAVGRLLALGATPQQIAARFVYIRPDTPATPETVAAIPSIGATLAVLDGITEAMTLHGLELKDNADVARFVALLPRPLADQGAAVLMLDHVVKDREGRGRFAIGAQHKLAGIDGAAYSLEVIQPFGRGMQGVSRLTVTKDRPGFVRPASLYGKGAGDVHLRSFGDGGVEVSIRPALGGENFRPTFLMERVSRYLETLSEPVSTNQIEQTVPGKGSAVRRAVDVLIAEGFVRRFPGPRSANLHELLKPFREAAT